MAPNLVMQLFGRCDAPHLAQPFLGQPSAPVAAIDGVGVDGGGRIAQVYEFVLGHAGISGLRLVKMVVLPKPAGAVESA